MSDNKIEVMNESIEISKKKNEEIKLLPDRPSDVLNKFKEEILAIISENSKNLEEKIENYKSHITKQENQYNEIIKRINSQYSEILSSQAEINTKIDKFKGYDAFVAKTTDQITTHEIRMGTIKMDLNKAIEKYDKIYLENLVYPGVIGNFCKYKNCKDFFEDIINQFSKLNSFRERNILDLKSYKEKLEGIIKTINIMVDNNSKANMQYSNEIGAKTERNCKDMIEIVNERMMELRLENTKYAIELKEKSLDLSKDWEKILKIKEEINELFKNQVDNFRVISNNTINSFNEFKKDYGTIKSKFFELAEFIKDVRFRKNLGNNVQKKEIKNVVKKITSKRKNSYDERELKLTKKDKEVLNVNFLKNDSKSNLRQSQSQDVQRKVKNYNNKEERTNNIKRITSANNTFNSKEDSLIDTSSNMTIAQNNNNNNNRYLNKEDDKVIQELAPELEQSNNRIDLLKKNLETKNTKNNNILNNKSLEKMNENENINNEFKNKILHSISSQQTIQKNLCEDNTENKKNIINLKKENNNLSNKLNQIDKKLKEFENTINPKINEILNQIESIKNNNVNNNTGQNSVNNNYNFIHGNITNYGGFNSNNNIINNNPQSQNSKIIINNNTKVPSIETGKFPGINQNKKVIPVSSSPTNKKSNFYNRVKTVRPTTGRPISKIENVNHNYDNLFNENNNSYINSNINIIPDRKTIKIESKKENNVEIKFLGKTQYNSENNNDNIHSTRWVQLNKINSNQVNKGQNSNKLSDFFFKDD